MKKLLVVSGGLVVLAGLLLLAAGWAHLGQTPAKLTWDQPEFRSSLMTFAYKVYGNPKVENGRHFLSKITFKNTGEVPVTDFAISYKLQDYVPWTDPETMPEVPAGFSFAKLYYPRLPAEVTKLHTQTTCTLQVKTQWKENGRPREEVFKHDILLHPVNELTYSDLPAGEVESWYDAFDTSDFAVSMVTPNDPVVAAYAAQITKLSGGTTAGIAGGPKEIYRLCGAAYEYMCRSGLRYTGDSGVPANFDDVKTLAQSVRLPRDVIQNNNGLCIELAIMWASVLQHLGVDAALVMVPGHCYVVAYSQAQGMGIDKGIPIECTSITPQAVNKDAPVSFDDSVKMAMEETEQRLKAGMMIVLPVRQYQSLGFTAPELPDVDLPRVTEMLERRMGPAQAPPNNNARVAQQQAPAQAEETTDGNEGNQPPNPPPAPSGGGNRWTYPPAGLSIDFPAGFASIMPPRNPGNVLVMVATNQSTSMACEVMHVTGTTNPQSAMDYIIKSCQKENIRLNCQKMNRGENGLVYLTGNTENNGVASQWIATAKPVQNGVVFVSAEAPNDKWKAQYNRAVDLLNHVHFQ